jgi:hypothetical protein
MANAPVIEFSQFAATGDGVLPICSFEGPGAFYTNPNGDGFS